MNTTRLTDIATFVFLSLLWGTTWIAIKYSLSGIPPFAGAMLRFMVAIALLYGYARIRRISLALPPGARRHIFTSSILLYLFDYGLIYWGEQYLYAGVTAIFFATFPIFTGLISNFVLKNEPFQWSRFAGLLLGFGGILTIFQDQLLMTDFHPMIVWASAGIVLSALAGALSIVIVEKHLAEIKPVPLTLHQMIWGIVALGAAAGWRGEFGAINFTLPAMLAVFYLGIFGSAVAFVSYYSLLKRMSAITLSFIIYITPVVALLTGWYFLDETITWRTVAGALLIFAGITLTRIRQYYRKFQSWRRSGPRN